ncbi:tetratricopeptide repeat protein [Fulvivirga ulvae]|uniref:tetratricopeptide repeat protein n=1 Tax=Fulvivirga ulvae TaxID=2904245 RepID=UPI001F451758|nr:tetratricopeptide repeat protein [Fulvivirga ulvae]UII32782.1 tetratricopeptide repeat protein [Fulvivirga ulvae]
MRYLLTLLILIGVNGLHAQKQDANLMAGHNALSKGEYKEAIEAFSNVLKYDKDNKEALIHRSKAYYSLKDYEKTIADCDAILNIDPELESVYDLSAMHNMALAYNSLKKYDRALLYLDELKQLQPDYLPSYESAGYSHLGLNQLDLALQDFKAMVRLDSTSEKGYYGIGMIHYLKAEYSKAIEAYNQAIQINPDYAMAYQNRGSAKRELGDMEGCCVDWNKSYMLGLVQVEAYLGEYCR